MHVPAHQAGPAPTARRLYASKSARTGASASRRTRASASTAGSMPIVPLLSVLLLAVMVATARGLIPVPARRNGVEKIAEHPSVNRNARMGGGASRRTRASARPSGTATTAGCPYVTKVSSRLMGRRKRVLEYQKAIPL